MLSSVYTKDMSIKNSGIYHFKDAKLIELHPNYFDATHKEVLAALSIHELITKTIYFIETVNNVESIVFNKITREPLVVYGAIENTHVTMDHVMDAIATINWEEIEETRRKLELLNFQENLVA